MAAKLRRVNATLGQMQKNLECSICLDLLQDPVSTKCDHQFCNFCILALLDSRRNSSAACPLCKEPVTKRSLISNDRLNEIVRAVRGVVQAVEQDTGFRCTPPKGPRVLSQQSQTSNAKPKETSPNKKTNKTKQARKRGNLRQATSKTATSVQIYIDSDDTDVLETSTQGIALITDFNNDVVEDKLTRRSSRETRNRKPLQPVNQVQTSSSSVSSSSSKSQDEVEENHLKGPNQDGCNILEALKEGSLGVTEQKDAKSRRQVTERLKELRMKVAEGSLDGLVDENTSAKRTVKLVNREESNLRAAAKILNQSQDKGDCLLQALDQGSFGMLGDFDVDDSCEVDKSHLDDSHTKYSSNPDSLQDVSSTRIHDARNNVRAHSKTTEVPDREKNRSTFGQGKLPSSETSPSSAEEDPYEFIASQRTPRKPKPKRARCQKNPSGKSTKEFDYMKWKKSNSVEKKVAGGSQAAGSQASTQIQLVTTTSRRSDESRQSQDEQFFREPPEVKRKVSSFLQTSGSPEVNQRSLRRKTQTTNVKEDLAVEQISPKETSSKKTPGTKQRNQPKKSGKEDQSLILEEPHIRQLRSRAKNLSTSKEDIVESGKDIEKERTSLEDNQKARNKADVTENGEEVIPSNEDDCLAGVDSDEDNHEDYRFEDMSIHDDGDEGSSLGGPSDSTYKPSADTSICKSAPDIVSEVNLPKRQSAHTEENLVAVPQPHQDRGSSLESLTDPSYEPSTETPTSLRTIPEIFTDGNPPRRQSRRIELTLISAPRPQAPHADTPHEGHGEELMGCSQPQVKKHSPLASAGVFGQVYKKLKKSPKNDLQILKKASVMDVDEKVEKMFAEVECCSDDEDRSNVVKEDIVEDGDTEGSDELDPQNSFIVQAKGSASSVKGICKDGASKQDFVDQEDNAEVGDLTVDLTEESDAEENNLEPQLNQNSFSSSKEIETPGVPQEAGPLHEADVAKSDWEMALELAREFDTEPRQFSLRSSRRGKPEPESKDQFIHPSRTKPELEVSVKNKSGGRALKSGEVVETSKAHAEAKIIETRTLKDDKQVTPTESKTDHTITAGKKTLRQTSNSTTTNSKTLKDPTSATKLKRRSIRRSRADDKAVGLDGQGELIESYDSNSDHCALSTKQKAITRTPIPTELGLASNTQGKDFRCDEVSKTFPKEGTEVDFETAETSSHGSSRQTRRSLRCRSCEKSVSQVSRKNENQENTPVQKGRKTCDDVPEGSSSVHSGNNALKEDEHGGGVRDTRHKSRNDNSSAGNTGKGGLADEKADLNTLRDPRDDSFEVISGGPGKTDRMQPKDEGNQATPNQIASLRIPDDGISSSKEELKFQRELKKERKKPESCSLSGSVSLFTADDEQQREALTPMVTSPQLIQTNPQQTGMEDGGNDSGESDRTESIDLEGEDVPAPIVTIGDTIPSGSDTESIEHHEDSDDSSSIQFVSQGPQKQLRKLLQDNQTRKIRLSLSEKLQHRMEEISPMQTPTSFQKTPDQTPQERSKRRSSRKAKRLPEEMESDTEEVSAKIPSTSVEKLRSIVSEATQLEVGQKSTSTDESNKKSADPKLERLLAREKSNSTLPSRQTNKLSKRRQKPSPDSSFLRSFEDSSNQESEKMLVSLPDHYRKTFIRNPDFANSEKPSPKPSADSSGRRETTKRKSCPDERSVAETKPSSKRQRSAGATGFSESKILLDDVGTRRKSQRLSGVQKTSQDIESQQFTKSDLAPTFLEQEALEESSGIIKDTECSTFGLQTRRKSRSLSRRGSHLRSQTSEITNSSQRENTVGSSRVNNHSRQKGQESLKASEHYLTNSPLANGSGNELGSQSLFDEIPAEDPRDQALAVSVSSQNGSQVAASSGEFETASEGSSSLISNPIISPKKNQQGCSGKAASEENQVRDPQRGSKEIKQIEQSPKRNSPELTHTEFLNSSEQLKDEPCVLSESTKSSYLSSKASLSIPFQGRVTTGVCESLQKPTPVVKRGMSEGGSRRTPFKETSDDFVSSSEGASVSPSRLSEPILIPRKHRFGKDLDSGYQKKPSAVTESIHVSGNSQDVILSSQPSPKPHPRKRKSSSSTASRSKPTRGESRESELSENRDNLNARMVEGGDTLDLPQETHQNYHNVREHIQEGRDDSSSPDLKGLQDDDQAIEEKKDGLLDSTKDEVRGADVEDNFDTSSDVEMVSADDEQQHHDDESDEEEENCQESDDEEDDDDDDVIIPPTPPCQVAANLQSNKRSTFSISSTTSLASSNSFKSTKSFASANQSNSSRSNQTLKATNPRKVQRTAAVVLERNTEKRSVAVGADEPSLDNSFERSVFPLQRSPARRVVLRETEQDEDTRDNSQRLSIFQQNISNTSMKYPKTKQQEAILGDDDDEENVVKEGEDEEALGRDAEILEGGVIEEAGEPMEDIDAGKDGMNLMEGDDNKHENVMTGIEDHHYDTEGSCCSESNCSHHLNLTSASSVLSSQSELMNTQQRIKAQESLQKMAVEIAQMEAALEGDTDKHPGHKDDPEVEDHVKMEEESEVDDHDIERQPSKTEDPEKMLDVNDVESNCSDDDTHADLCTPADLCSQKDLYSSNNDSRDTHSIKAIADSYIPASQGDGGQSPQRSYRRSKPVISDDQSDSDEEIAGIAIPETNVVNSSPCRSSRSQLEIPGVTTYGSDSDISEPEEPDIPSGSPRSPSPPPDLSQSTTRRASLANLPESVQEVSRLAAKFRSGGSRAVDVSPPRGKGHSKNRSKTSEGRSWMHIDDLSDDDYTSSPRRSKNAAPQKSRSVPERQTSGWKSKTLEMKSARVRILPRPSESVKNSTPLRKSRQPGQALLNTRRNLYHSKQRDVHLNKSGRGDRDQDGPSERDHLDGRGDHHREESPEERSLSPVIGRSRHTTPGAKKTKPISFVSTGLNRQDMKDVEQLAKIFGCRFASTFNACTTHVIVNTDESMVCERTLKYFQGIAARKWVVSFKWVSACLKTEELLPEEPFEVRGDVVNGSSHKGPRRARLSQPPYPLHKYDVCCVGHFTGLNKEQLVSLVELVGASTVQHPSLFPYNEGRKPIIVAQADVRDLSYDYDALYRKFRVPIISREWILDIIATYKIQPMADYLLSSIGSAQPIIDLDSEKK